MMIGEELGELLTLRAVASPWVFQPPRSRATARLPRGENGEDRARRVRFSPKQGSGAEILGKGAALITVIEEARRIGMVLDFPSATRMLLSSVVISTAWSKDQRLRPAANEIMLQSHDRQRPPAAARSEV